MAGVQQLWIIDMGQEGDISRYKKISSYASVHTEALSAGDMTLVTYAHVGIVFNWRQSCECQHPSYMSGAGPTYV